VVVLAQCFALHVLQLVRCRADWSFHPTVDVGVGVRVTSGSMCFCVGCDTCHGGCCCVGRLCALSRGVRRVVKQGCRFCLQAPEGESAATRYQLPEVVCPVWLVALPTCAGSVYRPSGNLEGTLWCEDLAHSSSSITAGVVGAAGTRAL
jgi:hypothetical protein